MMIISKDLAKSHAQGTLPPASVLSSPAYFLYLTLFDAGKGGGGWNSPPIGFLIIELMGNIFSFYFTLPKYIKYIGVLRDTACAYTLYLYISVFNS